MKAFEVESKGSFMKKLLSEEIFDSFYVKEAVLTTFARFEIDGSRNAAYYSSEELRDMESGSGKAACDFVLWGEIRKTVYELIKGRRLPSYMQVVLMAPEDAAPDGAAKSDEFLMTVRFKDNLLYIISGVNHRSFPFDKETEKQWDIFVSTQFS